MKKIIYLPLIALIALCSCKSNSFMKQRYTNFAHHNHKTINKEKANVPDTSATGIIEPETFTTIETESAMASGNNDISKENILAAEPALAEFNTYALPIYKASSLFKKTSESLDHNTLVKDKKVTKQKSQLAHRIIGTLLKIVLWIIILAVVVGVLLIIGALA